MNTQDIEGLEEYVAQFPVFEYRIIRTGDLRFENRVRLICKQECERYNTTWACPPAVGTLAKCEKRCRSYAFAFFFSSVAEVSDIMNMSELLKTRDAHEEITNQLYGFFKAAGYECAALSTESCAICKECTYPNKPCRFPKRMHPCLESHGVVVSDIVEKEGMTYSLGGNTILWFSMILFREG